MKIHRTNAGDFFDLVSCIAYGRKQGDDRSMHRVLEANPDLLFYKQLSANIELNIPDPEPRPPIPLVPWTEANA